MSNQMPQPRESMDFDVLIVGGGPAGLSASIRLKQLNPDLSVVVLEKGAEIGAHILSGAVIDPIGMDTLMPDWRNHQDHPFKTAVREEWFLKLSEKKARRLSHVLMPKMLSNHGCYIVSLGNVCRFLAHHAENLGVEIYPGFAAVEPLFDKNDTLVGVATGDMGIQKDGSHGPNYMRGIELRGKYLLIGEGARGSLAKKIIQKYHLNADCEPQKYGIGIKELWQIDAKNHRPGFIQHTSGWPLDNETGGGSFLYHLEDNQVATGFVMHLDYKNPYLSAFEEFQRFKTHPAICKTFEGGRRISYGARAITEGGYQSVPKLSFPGGALIGCSAGFVNVPRIKGAHNAILSGYYAANHLAQALSEGRQNDEVREIETQWRKSLIGKDLYKVRNAKPLWSKYGTRLGLPLAGFDLWCQSLLRFSFFGTVKHRYADYECLQPAAKFKPMEYPKPDNHITFDILSSVYLSNTHHNENEPCHLKIGSFDMQKQSELTTYAGPSTRYCPAGVYEWVKNGDTESYIINAQNCVHCKTCDIKDPNQNIEWTCPQGGEGPVYPNM
ncbi:electron transfer flavoprotein-ubiquinone oxidoreductase [Bartonella tamiae]|uniref:Electron transfer flavoprotein-ubiquinone oxidoreductase n=1 Tax=Bartonella tamiae Th239 TaxID=1094558 RepID=J1JYX6_9HYPH|nr:electron transfer flavoprotein-ubiquinone oxidoreductase [Bartonella tamiae]EJF90307.1 hypothetical protein ME5_00708 [Bartonella tamiae Th239]EJF93752.1 hypothetical protein MEG_01176 [Bartonella tamiae Th307]